MEVEPLSRESAAIVDDRLLAAWQNTLPEQLEPGDGSAVQEDGADPHSLRVTIDVSGRTGYSFDFKCTYLDERELRVELVDVQKDGHHVDERNDHIQQLIEDEVRHIHECAQALHALTKA